MPINCPLSVNSPSTEEFGELDYAVMRCAFATHRELGRLADEPICQAYFVNQLKQSGFDVVREVPIDIEFETFQKQYFVDMIVSHCGVYEVKMVADLTTEHKMQLLNYLFLLDIARGKLINFRPQSVQREYVNAPARRIVRQNFQIEEDRWTDATCLRSKTISVLRDWGTGLALPLYIQAATHFLGGEFKVIKNITMEHAGHRLGRQRFYTTSNDEAFQITALRKGLEEYEINLRKLRKHSTLRAIHWINISISKVTLVSVG